MAPLFFIGSSSFLLVTMITLKYRMSSKFDQIVFKKIIKSVFRVLATLAASVLTSTHNLCFEQK